MRPHYNGSSTRPVRAPERRRLLFLLPIAFVLCLLACGDDDPSQPPVEDGPAAARNLIAGAFSVWLRNDGGSLRVGPADAPDAGVLYQDRSILFEHGIWIGAVVGGETRVTATSYLAETDCRPLLLTAGGPEALVYILRPEDPRSAADWVQWPIALGAPENDIFEPLIYGSVTAWTGYHDRDPASHFSLHATPLGAEIRETVWAQEGFPSSLFYRFEITNASSETWVEARLGVWTDPDLGAALNDLVGCDVPRALGFAYTDPEQPETGWNGMQPAAGIRLLRTPEDLGFAAFPLVLKNSGEPTTAGPAMNLLRGLTMDGQAWIDSSSGEPTRYWASGDPVTGTGHVETLSQDRRMLMGTGPLDLAPGAEATVIYVLTVALAPDPRAAVTTLRSLTDAVAATPAAWDLP